jgi:hypothetical protein
MVSMRRRLRGISTRVSGAPEASAPAPAEDPEPAPEESNVDPILGGAVDVARRVAREAAGAKVGAHLGAEQEADFVVTHAFASNDPAYVGWRWVVTLTRAEDDDKVTVDDVVLLPGEGALLAPEWVPWSERVQPGDLAPGDLLPPHPDDLRLVPSYTVEEAELAAETFWELGLGRPRTLSFEGRVTTADRWYDGEHGPFTPMARQAPGNCLDCAFRLPLAGSLSQLFGVCANAFAPDDGKVVALDHGCGAHSEVVVDSPHANGGGLVVEDEVLELVALGAGLDEETPDGHAS